MSQTSSQSDDVSEEPTSAAPPPPEPHPISKGLLFNVIVPLALLALGGGFILAMGEVKPQARPADDTTRAGRLRSLPPVRVERLSAIDVDQTPLQLTVDGTVVPFREARVAAEVAGQIVFKADECEAGTFVNAGQLLMKIDKTDTELEVQRLSRLKEQEYQALAELDQELKNTSRSLEVARQDLQLQQAEVDRLTSMPKGFASRGEIDQAKRSLLQATQAKVNYENTAELLKKKRVRLEASERLAAIQLKVAEVNLARTEIVAPIDGVIVSEDADLNTFVSRGTLLLTIEDTSRVEVATSLRMDQLYWVLDQSRGPASPEVSASGGYQLPETPAIIEYELSGRDSAFYRWEGRLLGYDGIGVDPNTRTVPVRVVVDQPREFLDEKGTRRDASGPAALVRGMYVRVILLIKPTTPLVVIPARALKPGNRVWQFIPDETVLDVKAATAAATAEGETDMANDDDNPSAEVAQSDEQPAATANENEIFDPDAWAAGRVVVRTSIYPVDSLHVDNKDTNIAAKESSILEREQRMWVCEVRDQSLQGNSFVVTSPLGSIQDEGLAARADAKLITLGIQASESVAIRTESAIDASLGSHQ